VHAGLGLRRATAVAILAMLALPLTTTDAQLLERRLRSEAALLESPPGELKVEFSRIRPSRDLPKFRAIEPKPGMTVFRHSAEVDVDELHDALSGDGLPEDALLLVVAAYAKARQQIWGYAEAKAPYLSYSNPAGPPTASAPKGLPAEFSLYLRGALAYANGDPDKARESWLKLLELPPEQRRHRSVWAAYMLGRCPPDSVTDDWSVGWYQRCRELAADGCTDKLGLAEASYGWEAKLHFDAGRDAEAIDLYLTQVACDDEGAVDSLAIVSQTIFAAGGERLRRIAEAPPAVAVLCAFAGARGGAFRDAPDRKVVHDWVRQLKPTRADLKPVASQIAWAAYAADDTLFSLWWCDAAGRGDARAEWVRSRLLIRAGQLEDAVSALLTAADLYRRAGKWSFVGRPGPVSPAAQCHAEAGVLLLAKGEYLSAFNAFRATGYRDGLEFVAERVLTADELCKYERSNSGGTGAGRIQGVQSSISIRSLCTRRLVRLGRWDEARDYDVSARPTIDAYREAIRRGSDADAYAEDRAHALWEAATIAHDHGRTLFYRASSENSHWRDDSNWKHLRRSRDEAARFAASDREEMKPNYPTYVAGTHAWRAAELLPDEEDQTALILNTAGRWYAVSDNDRADRFYKALVRRCGTTKLGRLADRGGWFVP
jgi:tetratricopeptide (TPR) repeat protein